MNQAEKESKKIDATTNRTGDEEAATARECTSFPSASRTMAE